jgi:hypothetical protein
MRRFSIRSLMAFVLVSAVGLAALRNSSELWAGVMLIVVLAAVGVAVLGVVILRDRGRYWWLGFAVFSGGYLALAFGPWLSDTFRPQLGTTYLLGHLRNVMFPSAGTASRIADATTLMLEQQLLALQGAQLEIARARLGLATTMERAEGHANPSAASIRQELKRILGQQAANKDAGPPPELFQRVGHSLFALLAGLVGGTVAVWFYTRRESDGSDAGSLPHPAPERARGAEGGGR